MYVFISHMKVSLIITFILIEEEGEFGQKNGDIRRNFSSTRFGGQLTSSAFLLQWTVSPRVKARVPQASGHTRCSLRKAIKWRARKFERNPGTRTGLLHPRFLK